MSSDRSKLLVINLGWEQQPLIEKLAEMDLDLYGVHCDHNFDSENLFEEVKVCGFRELPEILDYAADIQPDAVISDQCDYSYFAQACVSERLDLPGPSLTEAQVATNKYLQRESLTLDDVHNPPYQACRNYEELEAFISQVELPVIIKPVDNRGGFGVHKITDHKELKPVFYDAMAHSHSRVVIAEKYIEGQDITVDGYCFRDEGPVPLALATKDKLHAKKGILDGNIFYPGELPQQQRKLIKEKAQRTVGALGFEFGFFHGEFILTDDNQLYLTEMANRGGGVYTSEVIVPNVTGLDVLDVYVNDVLGEEMEVPLDNLNSTPTVMRFFCFEELQGKTIQNIKGIKTHFDDDDRVLQYRLMIEEGDTVDPIENGAERHGLIIATDSDPDVLKRVVENKTRSLEFQYE